MYFSNPSAAAVLGLITASAVIVHLSGGVVEARFHGQWTDKPNYFSVSVYGNQAESCSQYLSKGRPVAIDGRLEWREWTHEDTKREGERQEDKGKLKGKLDSVFDKAQHALEDLKHKVDRK